MTALPPLVVVFGLGLVTALATGLGAIPFAFLDRVGDRRVAMAEAAAAGLMLGASFGLLTEGRDFGIPQTIVGGAVGALFIIGGQRLLSGTDLAIGSFRGAGARQVLLIVGVMTLHSFSEGIAVGVAFGGGEALAGMITIAIAVHNIPEGLAISAVMRPKGASVMSCALWSVFSSLPQPLMAVPAFLFVHSVRPVLPYGLGFAAGAMVFMVLFELLPGTYRVIGRARTGLLVTATMGAMVLFQQYL